MKKPNIWISFILGIIFSIVSLAAYVGTAFIPGLAGNLVNLVVVIIIFGVVIGCIFHIVRNLRWAIEEDHSSNENVRRYKKHGTY